MNDDTKRKEKKVMFYYIYIWRKCKKVIIKQKDAKRKSHMNDERYGLWSRKVRN